MTQPVVSVITRTKDRPLLLPRALQSVIGQTHQLWEMIVVNDGGQRDPVDVLVRRHDSTARGRVRVLHRDQSHGMEAASNAGIAASTGKYLVIHDDDDSWHPKFLETCVEHMERSEPQVGGVITHSVRVNEILRENEVELLNQVPYNPWLTSVSILDVAHENTFPPISFLFRRSIVDEVGGFREDLPVLGDWEFNLRVLSRFRIDVIRRELANYHLRQQTTEGIYGNTVVAGLELHERYSAQIRDELLRRDLQAGRFGLGFLVNLGAALSRSGDAGPHRAMREAQDRCLTDLALRLRRSGIRKIIVYGAGDIGRRFATVALGMGLRIVRFVDRNERLWGARIEQIEIGSLDLATHEGIHRYVIASFAFAEEIERTIRDHYAHLNLSAPEIYHPLDECPSAA